MVEREVHMTDMDDDESSSLSTASGLPPQPSPVAPPARTVAHARKQSGSRATATSEIRGSNSRCPVEPMRKQTWVRFRPAPSYDADEVGISAASDPLLSREAGMQAQDGLLFYAKEAHYELGLTPMILSWKDAATSMHAVESFPEPPPLSVPPADLPLIATLAHVPSPTDPTQMHLITCDRPPVVLAEIPATVVHDLGCNAQARLVRMHVINTVHVACGAEPEFRPMGLAGTSRTVPDCWSRILFQCKVRHKPVTLGDLRSSASNTGEQFLGSSAALAVT
jgi:hypothetical protein